VLLGTFLVLFEFDMVFDVFGYFMKWDCVGYVKRDQFSFSVHVFGWFKFDHACATNAAPSQQNCRCVVFTRILCICHGEVENHLPSILKAHLRDGCAALLQSMSVHATQLSVTEDALHQKKYVSVFNFGSHDCLEFGIKAVTSGQAAKVLPHVLHTVGDDLQWVDHGMVHDTFHVGTTCPDVPYNRILKLLLLGIIYKLLPRGDMCIGYFFNAANIHVLKQRKVDERLQALPNFLQPHLHGFCEHNPNNPFLHVNGGIHEMSPCLGAGDLGKEMQKPRF